MLAALRTYRLLAASLGALLLFGAGAPLVQHACAKAGLLEAGAAVMPCCRDRQARSTPAERPCHEASPDHGAPALQEASAPVAVPHLAARCCLLEAAPAPAEAVLAVEAVPVVVRVLAAPAVAPSLPLPALRAASLHPPSAFPPAPARSLHLLNATFLI